MIISEDKLRLILLKSGFVAPEELEAATKISHDLDTPLIDVVIERGIILERFLGEAIADHIGFPYADIKNEKIAKKILNLLPANVANKKRMVIFGENKDVVSLAMENPHDLASVEYVKKRVGKSVKIFFTLANVLNLALDQYKADVKADYEKIISENINAIGQNKAAATDLPVVKIFDTIIEFAASERASDIHIENLGDKVVVRFRVDGKLRDVLELPASIQASIITRIKIISGLRTDDHRIPQDGRFRFKHREDEISVRVSILPTLNGEDAELRLLSQAARPKTLEDLGLSGINLKLVIEGLKQPHGLILSTGPTGSGKTTTLYNILTILNTADVNICTIEDPIEYGLRRVNQIQVNTAAGLTFASGLRSILRHDPNIVLVGEIRDQETAEIATHAALTGHLVLSSLHTNDAISTIPRLEDLGEQPYLIASTLNLAIAQRLVPKNHQSCLVTKELDQTTIDNLIKEFGERLPPTFIQSKKRYYAGAGCDACSHTGFKGRTGIFEVLKFSEKIKQMIIAKKPIPEILAQAKKEGFKAMLEDGLEKVQSGLTTYDEIIKAVKD